MSLSACKGLLLKYDGETGAAHRAGSHHFLGHTDGRRTVVPVHRGEIIGPGLMSKILRDCEIERDEFMRLTK